MKEERFQLKVLVASLFVVAAALLASSDGLAANQSANTTINANVDSAISMSSQGNVNIAVTPTASGARMSSNYDVVTVNTNNAGGYTLTLEMQGSETSLLSGVNAIAQKPNPSTPGALSANTWGYRVAGGAFGAGAAAETNVASSVYNWAGVPANGSPVQIKTTSSEVNNDTTDVWYAIMADSTKPSGSYSGTVTYTATTN